MARSDLTLAEVTDCIARHYPQLSPKDHRKVARDVLKQIRAALQSGYTLATAIKRPDGSVKLEYLTIGPPQQG